MRPLLHLTGATPAAVAAYLFVKAGATDGQIAVAAAATDSLIGISNQVGADAGDFGDYIVAGEAELKVSAAVAYGARLTADATGQGIAATAGNNVGAIALRAGVAGDVIPVLVALGGKF